MAIPDFPEQQPPPDALLFILPLLIVLSTFLFVLLLFLVCIIFIRRRRGIVLRDADGPVDMSREELYESDGGFEGVESRWLESVSDSVRRSYLRAKGPFLSSPAQFEIVLRSLSEYQLQYPPNSEPTDITLSQFLSIQEKGVSAWCFEPDYETINSLIVHARTEITFLPDPASASCVQSNLPLPKLNEVYYWEVKMFDLPDTTTVAVGLATKPYPPFRLPGVSRHSVAYHSNGDKCYNYPFTASTFGPVLKEGDVLGVGYRPRTGTVFFTRNGRKLEDAFVGLSRYNLFPTIGADGPCSVHVNLGQAGFVFIEANVKKWGLAPSVGTLAPPPAYGSERGSILLDVGGGIRPAGAPFPQQGTSAPHRTSRRSHRHRRPKNPSSTAPSASSPLRGTPLSSHPQESPTPPPITPISEESGENGAGPSNDHGYLSPTDLPFHTTPSHELPSSPALERESGQEDEGVSSSSSSRSQSPASESAAGASSLFSIPRLRRDSFTHFLAAVRHTDSETTIQVHPPPDSPRTPNPPTPNQRDIHLQAFSSPLPHGPVDNLQDGHLAFSRRDPPAYSPLDAYAYAEGVHIDLPADVIAAALEGGSLPASAIGQGSGSRSERRRMRRERR